MDPNFYYSYNGFIVHDLSEVPEGVILRANPRLLGGKGGFGSMLRAIGSQIEKTTNKEMCRDLNGRRMRDVNYEKKLKEWLEKADEREKKKLEAYLEKRRKRKQLLEQGPSVNIEQENATMEEQRQQIARELQDAISEAFSKRDSVLTKSESIKPKKFGMNVDSDIDISSSDSNSTSDITDIKHSPLLACSDDNDAPVIKKIRLEENKKDKNIEEAKEIVQESKEVQEVEAFKPIDLNEIGSVNVLLTFDGDWLKAELSRRGLKCGGTLMQRAERLFLVKGLQSDEYPDHLMVLSNDVTRTRKRNRNKKLRD